MSLVPAHHNFTIYQGATFYQRIIFEINGEIQDLTGYSSKLIIKDEPKGIILLTIVNENYSTAIELGGKAGTIDIKIASSLTKDLTWESGVYELTITDSNERTDVLLRGGFKVILF